VIFLTVTYKLRARTIITENKTFSKNIMSDEKRHLTMQRRRVFTITKVKNKNVKKKSTCYVHYCKWGKQ
jgi:hypothetical protein